MTFAKGLIVVIGAGVTGLQTSISLQNAGYEVIIVAKHFPGDKSIEYTSPWAGGHWRSHAGEKEPEQQQWDLETYQHWLKVIGNERNQAESGFSSGLGLKKSRNFSPSAETPWYADAVQDYKSASKEGLEPSIRHAFTYTSIAINVPMYLAYLYETARCLGVKDVREELPASGHLHDTLHAAIKTVQENFSQFNSTIPRAFVNATGIAALNLVPDPAMYPVRGQTVLVRGEAEYITTIDAADPKMGLKTPIMYILPRERSGTTVLGGTKEVGNWSGEPDPEVTSEILARTKRWAPELVNDSGEFEILSVQTGLRPARKGGVRVEMEKVGEFLVCHAYGHAGAGYQNSVGSANKVVKLVDSALAGC